MAERANCIDGLALLNSRHPRPGQNIAVMATKCPVNRAQTTIASGYSTVNDFAMAFITGMMRIARHINMMPRAKFWWNCGVFGGRLIRIGVSCCGVHPVRPAGAYQGPAMHIELRFEFELKG